MKTDNKLIAEFMGENTDIDLRDPSMHTRDFDGVPCYDQYWDWLMPVVHKVIKLNPPFSDASIATPMDVIYKDVVEFIKRYNKQ